jgi:hypothetical protein
MRRRFGVSAGAEAQLRKFVAENDHHSARRALARCFAQAIGKGAVDGNGLSEQREQLRNLFDYPNRSALEPSAFMPENLRESTTFRRFTIAPGAKVEVIPYEFHIDTADPRPFIDVRLNKLPAENAFVRLAIARFQPNSIAACHLSEVTLVDFIQISPDRTVVLWRDHTDWLERTLKLRVHCGQSVPFASDSKLQVRVFKEMRTHGWAPAPEVTWTPDDTPRSCERRRENGGKPPV